MTSWQVHINPSASWWSRLAGLGGGIRQKLSSQTAETRIISRPSVGRAPPAWNGTFLSGILSDITQNLKLSCKHLHVVATEVKAAPWKLFLETYSIYPCFYEFSSFFHMEIQNSVHTRSGVIFEKALPKDFKHEILSSGRNAAGVFYW